MRMSREIYVAAKRGNLQNLQDLHRQNPEIVGKELTFEGNNVLHIAAREGHLDIATWILGVDARLALARNADKNTPLHEATKKGNSSVVGVLLQYSKRPAYKRNRFGETALILASQYGHEDATRLLLDATPLPLIFWPRDNRQTCLNAAVYEGHLGVVKCILGKSSCFNVLRRLLVIGDEFGATPLHVAVHIGHLEIVKEILKISMNSGLEESLMTNKDKVGRCAVHIAAVKGNCEIMDELMGLMPDSVEIRSACLKTALHFAVQYNQIYIVKRMLFENKDELNAKLVSYDHDMWGNTALHLAAMNAVDPELLECLLLFPDVKLHAINHEGLTALDIASSQQSHGNPNFARIATLLQDAGATHSFLGHPISKSELPRWWHSQQITPENGVAESKILDVDTLVASLIATITFAAMFQIPGGINENTKIANMSLRSGFHVFLFSDCLAFFASMSVVIAWIFRERLQTKLVVDRSALAKLSMLSLGTSIVSTGLAFLSATILVTIPSDLKHSTDDHKQKYQIIFAAEMLTAFVAPLLAVAFLSVAWVIEYYFKATNARQARLKWQLRRVVASTLPVAAIVLIIIFVYVTRNLL